MAVRRRAGSARKMMAFSRIVTCHTEEEYAKVFRKAGEKDLVLVEFVAGWSTFALCAAFFFSVSFSCFCFAAFCCVTCPSVGSR